MRVYKICPAPLWHEAEAAGVFRGAPVDLADGFIHFSTAGQVRETAARHFAGGADLLLLGVESDALGEALRFEPSRGGDLFPHLYGDLPVEAVVRVDRLPLGPDEIHRFPLLAGEAASFDPARSGWTREPSRLFVGLVGPFWTRVDDGRLRYAFLAEERHLNRGGIVHGGMLMSFADQALGMAADAADGARAQATIQLDTHFVSPAYEGDFVEARMRIVRRTASLVFMSCEIAVGARTVATANGVWKMSRPRNAPPGEVSATGRPG